ncbi:MAG: ribosomal protein, partial [Thermomicrobiales bacterium]|nr:ribosomal protein [Thermomicrobiales bacterium]
GNRRRHDYLKNVPVLVACNTCGEPHVVHHVCPTCGYYRGRQVIVIEERRRRAE